MRRRAVLGPLLLGLGLTFSGAVPQALALPPPPAVSPSPGASPSPAPSPGGSVPDLFVRGTLLAISQGYLFFTSGNGVQLMPDIALPANATLGKAVRVTLDQRSHLAKRIEIAPQTGQSGEIDASQLPSQYAVLAPAPAKSGDAAAPAGATIGSGPVTIEFNVVVPGNTPPNDDIYIATDRSNFSPAEIHMQRSDPQHWTASLTLPGGTAVHYEYTRGTYATVERDRFGNLITPRGAPSGDSNRIDDKVVRWADLN